MTPRPPAEHTGPETTVRPADRPDWTPPPALWPQLRKDPASAPALLAEAAIRRYGASASAWVRDARATYPTASATGLARLATREHARLAATAGAASMVTGPLGPAAGAATQAMMQARLVLLVAAAHGLDPTDPARAADIVALTRVKPPARLTVRTAAGYALWRAARGVPGLGRALATVASAVTAAEAVRSLADRAAGYYRTL